MSSPFIQVTVVPGLMVTGVGLKEKLSILTSAALAAAEDSEEPDGLEA